jgi:radical SAM superfamily enzyme YgiQ (UPF0313 family)
MADVLLAHCNHFYSDGKQVLKSQPYPPLQTLMAAAFLRQAGVEVALFDATFAAPEEEFRQSLERHRPSVVALCEDNFNFLTKMCLTRNRDLAFLMSRIAHEHGIPVVVNSSDASDQVPLYLSNGADYVILGELEITLLETIQYLSGRSSAAQQEIRGLAWLLQESGAVRRNSPRELLTGLDRIPPPAWDLVDLEAYRRIWIQAHGYFSLNLVSSRGCPFRCNWCAKPIHGSSYHAHSPGRVARDLHYLKNVAGADHAWFADDIFALSPSWAQCFADEVERLDAHLPFKMQSRCDLMTRDTVAALRRAGCKEVWMGAESGSQRILDAMDKDIRVEDIYEARANLRRNGIRACYFLQFGYPGESWKEIQQTIQMVRETEPDDIGISVSYPLPGTLFHARVAAELGSKRNWTDSGDLALMFRGPYDNEFYHALHDAMHLELELRRAPAGNHENASALRSAWARVEMLGAYGSVADTRLLSL